MQRITCTPFAGHFTRLGLLGTLALGASATAAQRPHDVHLGDLSRQGTRLANAQELGPAAGLDLDGDGFDDLALALPLAHSTNTYAGSVYVLFGPLEETYTLDPSSAPVGRALRMDGLESTDHLGRSLCRVGDLNADGLEDLGLASDHHMFVIFGGPHLRSLASIDLAQLDGTLGFELLTGLPGGVRPSFAPLADVNADGFRDLFLGLPETNTPWTRIDMRDDVRNAIGGDVDGDGDQDIVVAEGDRNTIVVLFNAGDGTFPTRTELALAVNRGLRLADLDGDGDLDLIAEFLKLSSGVIWEGWFAVFLNPGDGHFVFSSEALMGRIGRGVHALPGDLDGDGDLDIAGTSFLAETSTPTSGQTEIRTYLNNGAAQFTLKQAQTFGFHSKDVVLIDSDGDLDLDILVTTDNLVGSSTPLVRIHANNGLGGFAAAGTLSVPGFVEAIAVGDLTGDGLPDLFTTSRLFPNSPTGLQAGIPLSYPGLSTHPGTLADLDGNGTLDLVLQDVSNGISGHFNPGNGLFDLHLFYRYLSITGRPSTADFDGDGSPDILVEERSRVDIAFNRGDGTFGGGLSGRAFVVFGRPGIGAGGTLDLDVLDGTDGFTIPGGGSMDKLGQAGCAAGDMNEDGVADFAFSSPWSLGSRGEVFVVYGSPTLGATGTLDPGSLTASSGLHVLGLAPEGLGVSLLGALDVDGDNRDDLVLGSTSATVNGSTGSGKVRVLYGTPSLATAGTFAVEAIDGTNGYTIEGGPGFAFGGSLLALGDRNGDGRADFAASATSDDSFGLNKGSVFLLFGAPPLDEGAFSIAPLDGRFGIGLRGGATNGLTGKYLARGDWNGDGQPDLYLSSPAYPFGPGVPGNLHLLWKLPRYRPRGL